MGLVLFGDFQKEKFIPSKNNTLVTVGQTRGKDFNAKSFLSIGANGCSKESIF